MSFWISPASSASKCSMMALVCATFVNDGIMRCANMPSSRRASSSPAASRSASRCSSVRLGIAAYEPEQVLFAHVAQRIDRDAARVNVRAGLGERACEVTEQPQRIDAHAEELDDRVGIAATTRGLELSGCVLEHALGLHHQRFSAFGGACGECG